MRNIIGAIMKRTGFSNRTAARKTKATSRNVPFRNKHIKTTNALSSFRKFRSAKRVGAFLAILTAVGLSISIYIARGDATAILWSSSSGSAWLTGSNWTGSAVPTGTQIAQFGANPTSGTTGVGINFGSTTNAGTQTNGQRIEEVGAVEITSARAAALIIGNSSGTAGATGKFRTNGVVVNSISDVIIRNNSSQLLTIQNTQSSGTQTMSLLLGDATNNIINIDGSGGITISSSIVNDAGSKLTLGGAGTGTLTLSGVNTYTGDTTINSGKLALSGAGTINNSPNIVIAGGATFDVSGVTPASYTLASSQTLKASGTTSSGTLALGTKNLTLATNNNALQFTAFNNAAAPLTTTGTGTLVLGSGNPVTITTTTQLGAGDYTLVSKGAGGGVSGTAPSSVTVNGSGLAANTTASLQITGSQLVLHVVSTGTPTISVSTSSLSSFGAVAVGGTSSEQSYTVSGSNLTANITVTAPTDFEISTTSGSGFTSSLTLTQSGGTVSTTTIFVHFKPATTGAKSGNITNASTGATTQNVAVSGTGVSAEPTVQASNLTFSSVGAYSMTLNWTNGDGASRIVLAKSGSAVDSNPVDGTSYTASATFGSGSQIGTGNFVVFSGTGNSVTVTGLTSNTTYNFAVYEFNGSGGTENYLTTSPATGSQATATAIYRSAASGNWGDATSWEISTDGGTNFAAASQSPTSSDSTITIRNGHTITVAAAVTVDEVTIASGGQITISSGITLTLANGTGTDLTVNGTVLNSGTLTLSASATWAVNSGGTFIQNTTTGISTQLASATLDAASNFIYRGSSSLNVVPSISGRTYGNLSFESSSGSYSPTASSGASALTINGSLSVGTSGAGTVSFSTSSFTGAINITSGVTIGSGSALTLGSSATAVGGNWSNSGTFTPGTSTVTFNGTSQQQYTRTGTGSFNNLTLNNSSGLLLNNDLTIDGTLTLTSGTLTIGANTLTLNGAISATSGSLTGGSTSNITFGGSGASTTLPAITLNNLTINRANGISLGGNITLSTLTLTSGNLSVGSSNTVTVNSGGSISATSGNLASGSSGGTVAFAGAGTVSGTVGFYNVTIAGSVNFGSASTINNSLTRFSTGSVNTNPPTYATGSTLIYDLGTLGFVARGLEWSATSGAGYPYNVQINNTSFIDLGSGGSSTARQMAGTLTINSGGELSMAATPMSAALTVLGNVSNSGALTLSSLSGGDLHVQGSFTNNGTFAPNNGKVFFEGGSTQTINASSGSLTMPFVRINKSAGTVQLGNTDLTANGSSGVDSIAFTGTTSTFTIGAHTLTLGSTVTAGGTGSGFIGSSSSNLTLNDGGTTGAMGTLLFVSGGQLLNNLTLNRTSSGSATLGSDLTMSGTLALTNGILKVSGTNTLTLDTSASISRGGASTTDRFVSGNLEKIYSGAGSFIYTVGNDTGTNTTGFGYSPLDVTITAVNTANSRLKVRANPGAHPNLAMPNNALQRYWTLTETGDLTANLDFHYNNDGSGIDDVKGTEANYIVLKYENGHWTTPTGVVNVLTDDATVANVTNFSDWTLGESIAPTVVKLTGFGAVADGQTVQLNWQSGYEAHNLGYMVYREVNGQRTRVTPSVVAGSALLAGARTVLTAGHTYSWYDRLPDGVSSGMVSYYLEDIDTNGARTIHGPISPAVSRSKRGGAVQAELLSEVGRDGLNSNNVFQTGWPAPANLKFSPIGGNTDELRIAGSANATLLQTQQQVAGVRGVKIAVNHTGWQRVSQTDLVAAGLDQNADQTMLQLYANGVEVPISINASGIEFYGIAQDTATSDSQIYYLVVGTTAGKRVQRTLQKGGGESRVQPQPGGSFDYTIERRERTTYFPGLNNGDADSFFGSVITNAVTVDEPLQVTHLDTTRSGLTNLQVTLQGVTDGAHSVRVIFNGVDAGTIEFNGTEHPTKRFSVSTSSIREGSNSVQVIASGGDSDISLVDNVRLTYAHSYTADNNRLSLALPSNARPILVEGFNTPSIRVVDITRPGAPEEWTPTVVRQPGGTYGVILSSPTSEARSSQRILLIFGNAQVESPASVTANTPSSLAQSTGADFVIISHRDFINAVQPLAQLRQSQGLTVSVVDVEDVYDEFSYGSHSPQAIRDFLSYATTNWTVKPSYVLLVGDSTYDPRNYMGLGRNDMIPTKLLYAETMKTASDDWMADFNSDDVPDIAVGRLPVRTASDASVVINKITAYVPQPNQGALLISDRNDSNNFEAQTQSLRSLLPADMPVQVINRGDTDVNTVHNQIMSGLNQGPMVTNYYGHGSVGLWTGSGLLYEGDLSSLTNGNRLPVVTAMTCLNGFFHDLTGDSMAEGFLKSQQGGAVAVWASSGLTNTPPQAEINQRFYQIVFGNASVTIGDAVRGAKAATQDQSVRRTWVFFGDPTMRLR